MQPPSCAWPPKTTRLLSSRYFFLPSSIESEYSQSRQGRLSKLRKVRHQTQDLGQFDPTTFCTRPRACTTFIVCVDGIHFYKFWRSQAKLFHRAWFHIFLTSESGRRNVNVDCGNRTQARPTAQQAIALTMSPNCQFHYIMNSLVDRFGIFAWQARL